MQVSRVIGLTNRGFNFCGVFDEVSANVHIVDHF